ncbi:MAG: osmotically inducible protein OsmC [Sulfurimonas sp. RIFCSPHIGHO2_12_FULL_36_9]|uniref:OsmC family protein n=1 Tax=Sulfurimonas sp. RIFCSPLOWO2_12_36_12 TaxID=1802253 RepID=UPI0008BC1705|nr:OsmC family protein [Sulfurimonas sp. RIFCSPLOWO2_12_36_12]OHD98787.1 MAG: osmotically inducible protein OsmC [Sulfurimonas sp. RIFCSPHIGHO2_12_FULL_36_9]OHE01016.1 MAG: osmotically inducible protein OsmC [Sulfurimonas sp. RIFCSPLOWO2_02_FULL_36_28]OHE01441.1 MAG: osmotically inducible protein OsmC [Sulfurimonas sp. RIFCSPLOWO2_12_FULL_36_74]OHE01564.1 MAG: osmotically inducible protein OsmC [Sulfurimonas sp. RIFCSPLOWO2_12_36_12]
MKVTVSHLSEMKFEAKTQKSSFIIDAPQISPLEYFLSGIVSCSATDMVMIPKNQGKTVSNLVISGDAIRNEDFPKKFNTLHLDYSFNSDADDIVAARWVMASLETYCSTINTIRDSVLITYSITHNGTKIRENEKMISGGGSKIDMGKIESCPS